MFVLFFCTQFAWVEVGRFHGAHGLQPWTISFAKRRNPITDATLRWSGTVASASEHLA